MSKTVKAVIIELRPSKILPKEIGLFATRKLSKDYIIASADKFEERFVSWSQWKSIDKITKKKIEDFCMLTEKGFYVPPDLNYLSVPWNMNHSCDYNVGFDSKGNFVTTRTVKSGEELAWDYGMGVSYSKYNLICKCKSKNCRKVITGNDWKDKEFVKKNRKYFLRDLLS